MGLSDFVNSIVRRQVLGTFNKFDKACTGLRKGLDKLARRFSGGGLMLFRRLGVAGVLRRKRRSGTWANWRAVVDDQGVIRKPYVVRGAIAAIAQPDDRSGRWHDHRTATNAASQHRACWHVGTACKRTGGRYPQLIEAGAPLQSLNPSMGDAAFMTQSLIAGTAAAHAD